MSKAAAATLTPEARAERAKRRIIEGVQELVEATIQLGLAAHEWVDQNHSPFGKRRHLELARTGKIPSRKDGWRVFFRRDDLNAYLEKHGLARGSRHQDEESVEDIVEGIVKDSSSRTRLR